MEPVDAALSHKATGMALKSCQNNTNAVRRLFLRAGAIRLQRHSLRLNRTRLTTPE